MSIKYLSTKVKKLIGIDSRPIKPPYTVKIAAVLLAVWAVVSLVTAVLTIPKTDPDDLKRFPAITAEPGEDAEGQTAGECTHRFWTEDNVCAECGMKCLHRSWLGGRCLQCGAACPHDERDVTGRCSACGCVCRHLSYTDGICDDCGEHCTHNFEDSICRVCGLECPHEEVEDGYCTACLADLSATEDNSATPAA